MKLSWNMMDLAVRRLNVSALSDWKILFTNMETWMQAVLVGTLVLLVGVCAISCWWGLKMNRYARFAAGAAGVFHIALVIFFNELDMDVRMIFVWAMAAGIVGGVLNAFLERVFQFAAGFVFGTVLSAWALPEFFHLKVTSGKGKIWALVIAVAAGVLFALLAKKLKIVLTALEGGVILGLLCDAFLPVDQIPWVNEKLTIAQIQNLLPIVIAASGVLVQLIQYLTIRAEKKALQIPTGEERDETGAREEPSAAAQAAPAGEAREPEEAVNMAKAEELLVEKAKELASAARSSARQARQKERYEDVSEGLYSAEIAASRLGMSREDFLKGMKDAGFTVPGEETVDAAGSDKSGSVNGSMNGSVKAENVEEVSAGQERARSEESAGEDSVRSEESAGEGSVRSEAPTSEENSRP